MLFNIEAEGQELMTFSRHCSCLREPLQTITDQILTKCDAVSGRLLNKGAITTNNFHQNVDRRSSGGVVGVGTGRSSPRHAGRVDVIVICLSF